MQEVVESYYCQTSIRNSEAIGTIILSHGRCNTWAQLFQLSFEPPKSYIAHTLWQNVRLYTIILSHGRCNTWAQLFQLSFEPPKSYIAHTLWQNVRLYPKMTNQKVLQQIQHHLRKAFISTEERDVWRTISPVLEGLLKWIGTYREAGVSTKAAYCRTVGT